LCISIKTKTQSLKKVYKGCIRLLQILSHGQLPRQSCAKGERQSRAKGERQSRAKGERCFLAFSARGKLLKN
jgi:hypothetical protein